MYIRIEDDITKNLRYVYGFYVSTPVGGLEAKLTVKLDTFTSFSRGQGKRKWVEVNRWDRHCRRANHIERPEVPPHVAEAARENLLSRIGFEDQ